MARILVIDDAPVILAVCRAALEEVGHEVEGAADGAEGVARHRARPADLILCDLFMPIHDGFQAIRELRAFSTVPVVAMTGRAGLYPGSTCLEQALTLGADRTLRKPFAIAELLELVGELLQPAGDALLFSASGGSCVTPGPRPGSGTAPGADPLARVFTAPARQHRAAHPSL